MQAVENYKVLQLIITNWLLLVNINNFVVSQINRLSYRARVYELFEILCVQLRLFWHF